MIVVADSTPLHYLILLGQTGLLHQFYSEVIVPEAVADELMSPAAPSTVRDWVLHPPAWLRVIAVTPEQLRETPGVLDRGEREAIALAGSTKADLLLMDDAAGRAEAKRRGLRVTGTLGVLRAGAERGLVDVQDMLARLRTTTFYAADGLLETIFQRWLTPGE